MKFESYLSRLPRLSGKTVVVTGANSGIGLQTAKHLAYLGAGVVLACRNETRARDAMAKIRAEVPEARLEFASFDQASLASVKAFAKKWEPRKIDGFVFNAGIYGADADKKTEDGFPLIFGTNFIGAFYLSQLLRKKFSAEQTRLVFVISFVALRSKEQPLADFRTGSVNRQYAYSKLCLARYAAELAENGLSAVLVHPGISVTDIIFGKDTRFPKWFANAGRKLFRMVPNRGAKASLVSVRAICEPNLPHPYLHPRGPFGFFGLPKSSPLPEKFKGTPISEDAALWMKPSNS